MIRHLPALCAPGLVALGLLTSPAQADSGRGMVVTAGGDSSLYVPEDGGERSAFGYYARLSWETAVPSYTTESRGYCWALGIDPEVEFGRTWRDGGGQLTVLEAGLRLNAPFSQRRMGLLQVSARGGFWLSVRGGVTTFANDAQRSDGRAYLVPQQGSSPIAPDAGGMLLDLAIGEFILLGNSGLRLEFEFSTLMAEHADVLGGADLGLRMRAGLGAYF